MPQTPLPNTGVILPSDHGDSDTWDVILDNAFRNYDQHNHSAGSGAKVNISSLAIDADIPFIDSGGGKHAITSMKAISFFPSPPPVGINGSFFIADGTSGTVINELYYRTTLGTNVQFTVAGTLNVGAFAGTIGGDYTGVAALEIFDDASDAYWFQQQVGAAVRQYAKMQCADLKLFEFKAVGASPVPTNAVTLKSPAALAAGYALTFPGALPGSSGTLIQSDNTGILSFSNANLALATPTITNATLSDATVPTGHILTVTDGAATLKGMSYTTTRAFDANDFVAVSGTAVAQNTADHKVGVTTGSTTVARYPFPNPWGSHQTLTGITIEFYNDGVSVNRVTPTLKYIDPAVNPTVLNTVTGLSFNVSGHTLVMSGSPSISLQGVAERIFLLEFAGNTGVATMVSITTAVTT